MRSRSTSGKGPRSHAERLTPYDQAQRSWARTAASLADVPPEFAPVVAGLVDQERRFPIVVIAPTFEGFLRRETEKAVCATTDEVVILEKRRRRVEVHRYPFAGVCLVEVRSVLLDARLKVVGLEAGSESPASSTICYSAVTDFMFTPIVARLRSAGRSDRIVPGRFENAFSDWGRNNFKFMNYARKSLLGDEGEVEAILQPEIRRPIISAFGRTLWRSITATHATLLTDRELIDVRETLAPGVRERYGGVWTYLPLARIVGLSVVGDGDGLARLEVRLPCDLRLDLVFESSSRGDLDRLVSRFTDARRLQPLPTASPT
jgi:hypothetical protein